MKVQELIKQAVKEWLSEGADIGESKMPMFPLIKKEDLFIGEESTEVEALRTEPFTPILKYKQGKFQIKPAHQRLIHKFLSLLAYDQRTDHQIETEYGMNKGYISSLRKKVKDQDTPHFLYKKTLESLKKYIKYNE